MVQGVEGRKTAKFLDVAETAVLRHMFESFFPFVKNQNIDHSMLKLINQLTGCGIAVCLLVTQHF